MKETKQHLAAKISKQVELDYLLYLPEKQLAGASRPPLLLFLHGAGERGSDLTLLKRYGPPHLIESGTEFPFIVAAPQCPLKTWWQTDALVALLDHLLKHHDIDHRRIYLTGVSMGGHGTWELAGEHPQRFAAIAPVCGPLAWGDPSRYKDTPIWCFHGAMDAVVPIEDSIRMIRQIRDAGGNVRFTVYPDAGHDSWTQAYGGTALYDWLLTHSKP